MVKITKETKITAAGIGVGIGLPYALKKFLEPRYPFPIEGMAWSWAIPLITGPIALALLYMKKIKKQSTKTFLKAYGISTTIMGVVNVIDYYQILSARQAGTRTRLSSCPTCRTSSLPTKAQSAIRYPYLYAPQSDIWSVKPAGFGTMGYPYAPTQFSSKTILA